MTGEWSRLARAVEQPTVVVRGSAHARARRARHHPQHPVGVRFRRCSSGAKAYPRGCSTCTSSSARCRSCSSPCTSGAVGRQLSSTSIRASFVPLASAWRTERRGIVATASARRDPAAVVGDGAPVPQVVSLRASPEHPDASPCPSCTASPRAPTTAASQPFGWRSPASLLVFLLVTFRPSPPRQAGPDRAAVGPRRRVPRYSRRRPRPKPQRGARICLCGLTPHAGERRRDHATGPVAGLRRGRYEFVEGR